MEEVKGLLLTYGKGTQYAIITGETLKRYRIRRFNKTAEQWYPNQTWISKTDKRILLHVDVAELA